MWVIYDTETGRELDRLEDEVEALEAAAALDWDSDYDHYGLRWED